MSTPASPGAEQNSQPEPVTRLEPVEKTTGPKIIRKVGNLFSPSIKGALAGNTLEKKSGSEIQDTNYSEYATYTESFTAEQLAVKWNEYLDLIADRPNLRSTLSSVPEISEGHKLLLKIGNSVQEEEIRLVKPELVSWLRRELRNSEIELITRLEKIETERVHFNDSEKLQILVQKNPLLNELKQKFNLDFSD